MCALDVPFAEAIIADRTGNNGVAISVPVTLRGHVVETADFA